MTGPFSLPLGFRAAGIHCGIKSDLQKLDLSLFASDRPAAAAGVFTQNRVCGAPVVVSRERVPTETARAVLINSGNANACTGQQGLDDARASTSAVASLLGCRAEDVLVCSTGVIGRPLPMQKLSAGLPCVVEELAATDEAFGAAARGMMTTDTVSKQAMRRIEIDGTTVTFAAAAKGAAMIAPNMATMLAVVMTDAALSAEQASEILRSAVDRSFNRISIDGHTSTSDTVLLLANGAAGVPSTGRVAIDLVRVAVDEVCAELAEGIVRDAEGATHFISVDVQGMPSEEDAVRVARTVADSPLVKTAIAGADPNWGRIVSAAGYAGFSFEERDLSLTINGTPVYRDGSPLNFEAAAVSKSIRDRRDTSLVLTFSLGDAAARILTSDLTAEYVRLNADYTT
ncbi:MAG: bifunctional glutamate N-acetyltransferase/amino-acid acetyltransferase ArgJ [Planctomycetaceae bacterium]